MARTLNAQGNPSSGWLVNIVVQPNPSPFIADWERNPTIAVLNISYTNTVPADVTIEAFARNAKGEIARVASPTLSFVAGPTTQVFTAFEVADWRTLSSDKATIQTIRKTGVLPEGRYELCARIVSKDGVQLGIGCTKYDIALPEPPQLLFPQDRSVINSRMAVFQWTSVAALPQIGIRYRIRVVERHDNQTSQVAMSANPTYFESESNAPILVYPVDGLPLRTGRDYAWQIETIDEDGNRVTRGGKQSEIWTFRASDDVVAGPNGTGLPDMIELIPKSVRLGGFRAAQIREDEFTFTINGPLRMELLAPFPGTIDVEASGLVLDKTVLPEVRVLGGRLRGRVPAGLVPSAFSANYVAFTDLEYTTGKGLTFGAELRLPGSSATAFLQRVRLMPEGLYGSLSLDKQVLLVGDAPVRLDIQRVDVRYPFAQVEFKGGLELFGQDSKCTLTFGSTQEDGTIPITPRCLAVTKLPIAGEGNGLNLTLRNLAGTLALDPAKRGLTYTLAGAGALSLSSSANCGASFDVQLSNADVKIGDLVKRCDAGEGTLKLGWLEGKISTLDIKTFAWNSSKQAFDFDLSADIQPVVNGRDEFSLPPFTGVRFTTSGVQFPAVDAAVAGEPASFGIYDVSPSRVSIAATLVPWSVWFKGANGDDDGKAVGDKLAYSFTGNVSLDPILPLMNVPPCIKEQQIAIQSATLNSGELRMTLKEQAYPTVCEIRVSPSNSFSFELTRVAGEVVQRHNILEIARDREADIFGNFVLPEAFACEATNQPHKLAITKALHFTRSGGITGVIDGFTPKCPIDLPTFRINTTSGVLTLGVENGKQTAILNASATATFSLTATPVNGRGSMTVDLIAGKIVNTSIDFPGPFRFDLPREQPVLSFEIAKARLDTLGLYIDGRNKLTLGNGTSVSTTFDRVVINPTTGGLTNGRVLFDVPFALEAAVSDSAPPRWRTVAAGAPFAISTGLRVDLPSEIALTPEGFTASGTAKGRIRFGERDLDSLLLELSDDLALSIAPFAVRSGTIDFRDDDMSIAHVDRLGFHPNFDYFAQRLLPSRLPLPSEEVAYLQLRDDSGNLLVSTDTVPNGVRIRTRPGQTVALVFPALKLDQPAEPRVNVAIDLTVDKSTGVIVDGSVHARIPDTQQNAFNLMAQGLPVAFDTIAYERKNGTPFKLYLGGRLQLLGGQQGRPGEVMLSLDGDGRLVGDVRAVAQANSGMLSLVEGSDKLQYRADSVQGRVDANLKARSFAYDFTVSGALSLLLAQDRRYDIAAKLHATNRFMEVTDIATASTDTTNYLNFEYFNMRIKNLRVPKLVYSNVTRKFDFEILFDAGFAFPQFAGVVLPDIKDVALRDDGFTIPAYSIPDLTAASSEWEGFLVKPLAFRVPKTKVAWFSNTPVKDWGFRFDLELRFNKWGASVPEWVKESKLSVLDAGISNGYIVGRIEQREIEKAIEVGKEVVVEVKKIYGALVDPTSSDARQRDSAYADDTQKKIPLVDLYLEGQFSLGRHAQCTTQPEKFQVATGSLRFNGTGGFVGLLRDFVPKCPIKMGEIVMMPGSSVLGLGIPYDTAAVHLDSTQVWLKTDATVQVPGVNPGTFVNARGTITLDLREPKILDGYISLSEQFRMDLPAEKPVFTFIMDRGRIDRRGLTVTGAGKLMLDAGKFVGVNFNDLVFNPSTMRVTAGSASFLGKFALATALSEDGTIAWRATEATPVLPSGVGFVVTLPDTLTLSPAGLGIQGSAGASLVYGDSTFASLHARFLNGFTLDLSGEGRVPVRVSRGRLELARGGILAQGEGAPKDTTPKAPTDTSTSGQLNTLVAHLDSLGFWPGNVFGMLPIPAKLGLPDTAVAYLQLRDASGKLLVESSTSPDGVRLKTSGTGVVQLVVPALATGGAPAPTVDVRFDVTVNPQSMRVVAGEIVAEASPEAKELFSLANLGIPLTVRKLAYAAKGADGYALRLDGRTALPAALNTLDVRFKDLVINKDGITGEAELGQYAEQWSADMKVVQSARLRAESTDTLTVDLTGAKAIFKGQQSEVLFAGYVRSSLFSANDSSYAPLYFTARAANSGFAMNIDPGKGPMQSLPIALATFEPKAVGEHKAIEVVANADEFAVKLSGTLRIPKLGDRFAVTIGGLKIGTGGIDLPQISLGQADRQSLELFGSTFTLKDSLSGGSLVYPALALSRDNGVLAITMSGDMTFLGNTSQFYGLRVSSNGRIGLAAASLISKPIQLITNRLSIDTVSIRDDALFVSTLVSLPAPFNGGESGQRANFSIAADGSMNGGGRINLINEAEGLANAKYATKLPMLTAHLRYLGLSLDLASRERSALEMVGDLYVQNSQSNRIKIGSSAGGVIQPGLRFGFDGAVAIANVALADTFNFDYDVVKLSVTNISAPRSADNLALAFGGRLSLTLPTVKGGVEFTDFVLTSRGDVELKDANVRGGEFEIADVVRLDLSSFAYSRTPTTIKLASGSMPTGGGSPTADSVSIEVQSFARFGGSIDVKGVLAGGVRDVLFYKTADGLTQMMIRDATMNVYGVISLRGDFDYKSKGSDFEILLGAQGKILDGPGLAFVGIIAQEGKLTRMGVFAAASGLNLPITPVVTVTDLGAGFFYNPKAEYINYVRDFTGLSDNTKKKVRIGGSDKFAIMLYGGAEITPAKLVKGRVLVTVTPTVFMLDGDMIVLNQGDRFKGDAHLVVGLKRPYAEGNIRLNVNYGSVITGESGLEFFVYDNAWGINGNIDVELVKLVSGHGRMFVGSPGFLVAASIKVPSLWLISVKRAEAMAFYRSASSEWGATAAISVEVAVIPDVLSATGTLEGALIRPAGMSPFLYVVAELEAHVIVASFKGSVWAKVGGDGFDAGFGRDRALEQVIARAVGMSEEMNAAKEETVAAIADARRNVTPAAPIALTEAELASAYSRIQGWSPEKFEIARALSVASVENEYFPQTGQSEYFAWYVGLLRQQGAPADTILPRQYKDSIANYLSLIDGRKGAVDTRIREVQANITALRNEAADVLSAPKPPAIDTSFTLQTRTEIRGNDTVKIATQIPTFEVDEAAASAQVAQLEQQYQNSTQFDEAVRERLQRIEEGLATVRRVTTTSDEGSLLAYAQLHGAVLSAAERQYALQANQILRKQDWFRSQTDVLNSKSGTIDGILTKKTKALTAAYKDCDVAVVRVGTGQGGNKYDDIADNRERLEQERECKDAYQLKAYAQRRAEALQAWVGGTVMTSFNAAAAPLKVHNPWFATQADTYGRDLWFNLANVGMQAGAAAADTAFTNLKDRTAPTLSTLRRAYSGLSVSLNRLYEDQAELTGVLHDAYDRYLFTKTDKGAVPAELQAYVKRRAELRTDLTVPRVSDVRVTQSQSGYMTTSAVSWTAFHPSGVYEYGFRDIGAGDDAGDEDNALSSNGGLNSVNAVRVPSARKEPSSSRTVQVGAHGGAGYTGRARATYTQTFSSDGNATPATPVVVTSATGDDTPPTTPIVEVVGPAPLRANDGVFEMWLRNTAPFTVRWSAVDPESGIGSYDYAIGSAPGAADVREWTNVGGRKQMLIERVVPAAGQRLYISVRATNGGGQGSGLAASVALRYDATPPMFDAPATGVPATAGINDASANFIQKTLPVCAVGDAGGAASGTASEGSGGWQGQLDGTASTAAVPVFEIARPTANDAESRVTEYFMIVDTVAHMTFNTKTWTSIGSATTIRVSGAPLTYGRTYYVSLVAVNQTGVASTPHVIGPFTAPDRTPPSLPSFCVSGYNNGSVLRVNPIALSTDPETDIAGYEYRIRNGEEVVQEWSTSLIKLQVGVPFQLNVAAVPNAGYWVDIRAVNKQGVRSGIVTSGPYTRDETPAESSVRPQQSNQPALNSKTVTQ